MYTILRTRYFNGFHKDLGLPLQWVNNDSTLKHLRLYINIGALSWGGLVSFEREVEFVSAHHYPQHTVTWLHLTYPTTAIHFTAHHPLAAIWLSNFYRASDLNWTVSTFSLQHGCMDQLKEKAKQNGGIDNLFRHLCTNVIFSMETIAGNSFKTSVSLQDIFLEQGLFTLHIRAKSIQDYS